MDFPQINGHLVTTIFAVAGAHNGKKKGKVPLSIPPLSLWFSLNAHYLEGSPIIN